MATYKVGADGKAQSGLSVGDEVVTAGGTYKITGVNADGSYKSTLSNADQTTKNYAGSYSTGRSSAASTVPDTTDGTVKVANKNVYADTARNQDLAGQTVWKNGYAITYDANGYATKAVRSESPNYSGHTNSNVTGSGSAGGTTSGSTGQHVTGSGFDYSDYIKEMYAANMEAELAELEAAYEQNVGGLQRAGEKIGETYQAARNQAAAQNELSRQSMNEYFAARGLNTGTQGQMELAQNTAYQGQLGTLSSEEAAAITENQRQLDELEQQYLLAKQQAKAENNAAQAQALYEELVRAQTAAQEQANWERQLALTQQEYTDSLNAAAKEEAYSLAMTMLGYGVMPDVSTLATAGISAAEAQNIISGVEAAAAAKKSTSSSGSSGSSGMTLTTAKNMMKEGQFTDEAVQTMLNAGYNAEYLASVYGYGTGTAETGSSAYSDLVADLADLRSEGYASTDIAAVISKALSEGMITAGEANDLRSAYVGGGR